MKIHKGDKVKILLGKDRGKEGNVAYVVAKDNKVFVEGANLYKRHIRKMNDVEGGIIDIPKPLNISNVGLVCPSCKKVTRVGFKMEGSEKQGPSSKVRVCQKCGKEIISNVKK